MPQDYPDFTFTTHVRTLAADNIIIDKLTVGAYTARVATLENNGATARWFAPIGNVRRSKLFPRGARGFIRNIDIYCRDKGTAGGKVYVELWVVPYIGPIYAGEITVPAGGAPDWRTWSVEKFWNYDSLLIVCYSSSLDIQLGYDDGGPDCFHSTDAGLTWTGHGSDRFWFRADIQGMTAGDVPVSGTLNTIEIPGVTTVPGIVSQEMDGGTSQDIINVSGSGIVEWLAFRLEKTAGSVGDAQLAITFVIDGAPTTWGLSGLNKVLGLTTKQTIGVTVNVYDEVNEIYAFAFNVPFRFHRSCRIYITNGAAAGNKTRLLGYALYHLKR